VIVLELAIIRGHSAERHYVMVYEHQAEQVNVNLNMLCERYGVPHQQLPRSLYDVSLLVSSVLFFGILSFIVLFSLLSRDILAVLLVIVVIVFIVRAVIYIGSHDLFEEGGLIVEL
jgi:antibiotic biosynthesis monooxygenase (ABM) superfamily enzyme